MKLGCLGAVSKEEDGNMKWRATHTIYKLNSETIKVMVDNGVAYTEQEWDTESLVDWEINDKNLLLFRGELSPAHWIEPI